MPDAIQNPRTGQQMVFLNHDGDALLEVETTNPPTAEREPEHVHPRQESGARVTSGALVFEIDGVRRRVAAGESIAIPANTAHRFWNAGDEDACAVQWFRPALRTRSFFETFFALARDGKLKKNGMPGLLQIAVLADAARRGGGARAGRAAARLSRDVPAGGWRLACEHAFCVRPELVGADHGREG